MSISVMPAADPVGDVAGITDDLHIHSKFMVHIAGFWNVCLGGRNGLSLEIRGVRGLTGW